MTARKASHAGSWYTSSGKQLSDDLKAWVDVAHASGVEGAVPVPVPGCTAVIAPHAGYSYSGPAAAWAYKTIDATKFTRVFVLGPSHHVYLDGCALSKCQTYETPVGSLPLDLDTTEELRRTGEFEDMSISTDEDEHSIEMHLPYIRHIFKEQDIKIVPVLVGSISAATELKYGELLAPYLADPNTLFVVSSDFCHWGTRFSYTYYRNPEAAPGSATRLSKTQPPPSPPIHESIRALDHRGMSAITLPSVSNPDASAELAHAAFTSYLAETKNTVCGRHPIGVLLGAVAKLQKGEWEDREVEIQFVRYEQSSQCQTARDSSVSYASAYLRVE